MSGAFNRCEAAGSSPNAWLTRFRSYDKEALHQAEELRLEFPDGTTKELVNAFLSSHTNLSDPDNLSHQGLRSFLLSAKLKLRGPTHRQSPVEIRQSSIDDRRDRNSSVRRRRSWNSSDYQNESHAGEYIYTKVLYESALRDRLLQKVMLASMNRQSLVDIR